MNSIAETEAYFPEYREDERASEREELQRGREWGRINIENSDKEVIISTQSIFYPVGLLGGWR